MEQSQENGRASLPNIQVTPATPKKENPTTTRLEALDNDNNLLTVPGVHHEHTVSHRLGRPKKPILASLRPTSTGTVVIISRGRTHDVQFTIPNVGWYTPKAIKVLDEIRDGVFVVSVEGEEREIQAERVEHAVSLGWDSEEW